MVVRFRYLSVLAPVGVRVLQFSCAALLVASAVPVANASIGTEPPRFISPDAYVSLYWALATNAARTQMPRLPLPNVDAPTMNASVMNLLSGRPESSPETNAPDSRTLDDAQTVTTRNFQATLQLARQDAGEARELADEMHRKAEELRTSLVGGSNGRAVAATPAALPAAGASAMVVGDRPAVIRVRQVSVAASAAVDAPNSRKPPAFEGRMSLGHKLPAAGVTAAREADEAGDIVNGAVSTRGRGVLPPLPQRADKRKKRAALAAVARDGGDGEPARTNVKSSARPQQAMPAPRVAKTQDDGEPSVRAAAKPAGKPEQGGLFSWLKPLEFPSEIGAMGWAN